jgi:hypothetical protein
MGQSVYSGVRSATSQARQGLSDGFRRSVFRSWPFLPFLPISEGGRIDRGNHTIIHRRFIAECFTCNERHSAAPSMTAELIGFVPTDGVRDVGKG